MFNPTIFSKTARCIILAVALLLAWGCPRHPEAAALDRAERLMEEHPDSALALLDTIDGSRLTGEVQARHALLLSQALDKNYIDVTDDSLINIAVGYYEKSDDLRRLMLSHFYHARVLYNKESYARSLLVHHKSLRCAQQLGDDFWCGRNADQIYHLYENFYHSNDAMYYAQLSYNYFAKLSKQPYLLHASYNHMRANFNIGNYNEVLRISPELCDSAIAYNNKTIYAEAMRMYAEAKYYTYNYEGATKIIKQLLNENVDAELYPLLGLIYMDSGHDDLIDNIPNEAFDSLSPNAVSFKSIKAKHNGDFKTALHFAEILMMQNDSVLENSLNQGFSHSLADYYYYENQIQEFKLKNERRNSAFVIFILCLLILIIIFCGVWLINKQKRTVKRNITIAENLNDILSLRDTDLKIAQEHLRELLSSKYAEFNELCTAYYENQSTNSLKKRISNEVEALINSFSSIEKLKEFESIIDKNCSQLMSSLKNDLPNLKDADYRLFIYCLFGFSNSAISLFLKEDNLESVYNRKARLKTKIKKLSSIKKDIYLSYL